VPCYEVQVVDGIIHVATPKPENRL
jgi:hypothetical protein